MTSFNAFIAAIFGGGLTAFIAGHIIASLRDTYGGFFALEGLDIFVAVLIAVLFGFAYYVLNKEVSLLGILARFLISLAVFATAVLFGELVFLGGKF
jgi:hypothetical protein